VVNVNNVISLSSLFFSRNLFPVGVDLEFGWVLPNRKENKILGEQQLRGPPQS
jgi:hypothetical protein